MVVTVPKCHFVRIQPETIRYRDYHRFSPDAFIADLIQRNLNSLPVTKFRSNTVDRTLKIKNNLIQSESKVELLGLTIDNRLSFHSQISSICKKTAKQLNALKRLGSFLNFTQRKALPQSFVLANFNYSPTIWHFCSAKDQHKMKKVQERTASVCLC